MNLCGNKKSYEIAKPALAYPIAELTRESPAALAPKTNSSRVPCAKVTFRFTVPVTMVPSATTPLKAGVKLTVAPGIRVNELFGVVDWKSCAVTVNEEPTSDKDAVVLKKAVILVNTPARGIENAKLVSVPAELVKSMTPPAMAIPGAEVPNPTKAGVPTKPPTIVLSVTGIPEA